MIQLLATGILLIIIAMITKQNIILIMQYRKAWLISKPAIIVAIMMIAEAIILITLALRYLG